MINQLKLLCEKHGVPTKSLSDVIEAKKKKMWTCPKQSKFDESDEESYCVVTGAIIGNPDQCTPDCGLLQEET